MTDDDIIDVLTKMVLAWMGFSLLSSFGLVAIGLFWIAGKVVS